MSKRSAPALLAPLLWAFSLLDAGGITGQGQPVCPPGTPHLTAWIQAVLDRDHFGLTREALGLDHLRYEPVTVLGLDATDNQICEQLFARLDEQRRADLSSAEPESQVVYHRVGDRYLVHLGPSSASRRVWSLLVSFDLEFNEIDAAIF